MVMTFKQWRAYLRKELLLTKLKNMNYEKDERIKTNKSIYAVYA